MKYIFNYHLFSRDLFVLGLVNSSLQHLNDHHSMFEISMFLLKTVELSDYNTCTDQIFSAEGQFHYFCFFFFGVGESLQHNPQIALSLIDCAFIIGAFSHHLCRNSRRGIIDHSKHYT